MSGSGTGQENKTRRKQNQSGRHTVSAKASAKVSAKVNAKSIGSPKKDLTEEQILRKFKQSGFYTHRINILPYMTKEELHTLATYMLTMYKATNATTYANTSKLYSNYLHNVQKRVISMLKREYGLGNANSFTLVKNAINQFDKQHLKVLASKRPWAEKEASLRTIRAKRKQFYAPLATFEGPIQDVVGYIQTSLSCGADCIQQVLMFGSPWYSQTQPIMYNCNKEMFQSLYDTMTKCAGIYPERDVMERFIDTVSYRFFNHYNALRVFVKDEVCAPSIDYRQLYLDSEDLRVRYRAQRSAEIAYSAKPAFMEIGKKETVLFSLMTYWLKLLFTFLKLNYTCILRQKSYLFKIKKHLNFFNEIPYTGYQHHAFILQSMPIDRKTVFMTDPPIISGSITHATAAYKSDTEWHYFDNERGIFVIPQIILRDIVDEVTPDVAIGFVVQTRDIVLYKFPLIHLDPLDMEHEIQRWKIGEAGWSNVPYREFYERNTPAMIFSSTIHVINRDESLKGLDGKFADDYYKI
jgi:hypothetical protein